MARTEVWPHGGPGQHRRRPPAVIQVRHIGAHRRAPYPQWLVLATLTVGLLVLSAGVYEMTHQRPACRQIPMHVGWPNSRCRETWPNWKLPTPPPGPNVGNQYP